MSQRTSDTLTTAAGIDARLDRLPITSRHRRLTVVLAAGTFFDAFDALVLGVALTVIATTLGQGFLGTGLLISAGYIGQRWARCSSARSPSGSGAGPCSWSRSPCSACWPSGARWHGTWSPSPRPGCCRGSASAPRSRSPRRS